MNAEFWVDGIRIECSQCGGAGSVETMGPVGAATLSPPYRYEPCDPCEGEGWVYTENCEICTKAGFDDVLVAGICHERALCIDCVVEARLSKGADPNEQILEEWEPDLAELIAVLQRYPRKPGVKRVDPAPPAEERAQRA